MLLVVPLVAITGFPQWIPHFSALAFDDDDDDDDDLPWPGIVVGQREKTIVVSSEYPKRCQTIFN